MKMLACWNRMDVCAALQYAGLFGFYQPGQQELCYISSRYGGFNTGIRTFTTLGRAGGAVFRKPFSVSVSLIQGPCLGSPVTENRGELPDRLSLQHEELTFDAIET